jgi:Ca2+/Na+ antiporter
MASFNKEGIGKLTESMKNRVGEGSPAGDFFTSMKNRMGIGSPERNATDTYERGMKIVPDCISAIESEVPVKQYNIAVLRTLLKFERAEGRVQVTNKRVILRAAGRSIGGRTTLQHEFAINEIAGIEARRNYKFSFLYLVFAILIIALASFIIYGSSFISNIKSPLDTPDARISGIMFPKHLQAAYAKERVASSQRQKAEEKSDKAWKEREESQKLVTEWSGNAQNNPRRIHWFRRQNMAAQAILELVTQERDKAVSDLNLANEQLESARANEAIAIKERVSTENIWKVLMTLLGLILGIAGLFVFFALYKKFGLKLFILNFSILGFVLSLAASGIFIFMWLLVLSVITTLVCVFLFCFRPNLVISVKNKGGVEGAVDIRRDALFARQKGTGFAEVIPTEETESAIRELGAIIGDIQKLGDSALGKWTQK